MDISSLRKHYSQARLLCCRMGIVAFECPFHEILLGIRASERGKEFCERAFGEIGLPFRYRKAWFGENKA